MCFGLIHFSLVCKCGFECVFQLIRTDKTDDPDLLDYNCSRSVILDLEMNEFTEFLRHNESPTAELESHPLESKPGTLNQPEYDHYTDVDDFEIQFAVTNDCLLAALDLMQDIRHGQDNQWHCDHFLHPENGRIIIIFQSKCSGFSEIVCYKINSILDVKLRVRFV